MTIIHYHPVLSCKENIAKLRDVLCSQSGSSWLIGVKDLMLPLQYHLFFWRNQESNQLSEKKAQESKGCGFLGKLSPNLMSSESGLEGLETSPLF